MNTIVINYSGYIVYLYHTYTLGTVTELIHKQKALVCAFYVFASQYPLPADGYPAATASFL